MSHIKFSTEIPDIYYTCNKLFGVEWDDGVIFTYGDTVYCKEELSTEMKVHEATHVEQQKYVGAKAWWDQYLIDPKFRLEQELEAYRNQYRYMQAITKDRNKLFKIRHKILMHISSSMYGNMISYSEAMKLL